MKSFFTIIFIIIFSFFSCSQDENDSTIYNGNITFLTQKQIDDFGEKEYLEVTGNVIIGDMVNGPTAEITNLNGLNKLISVNGDLYIFNNEN